MTHGRCADPPAGCNRGERLQDEAPSGELRVGNGEPARTDFTTAPQRNVEVEYARSPSPAGAATEIALDRLQAQKHFGWIKIAFNQCRGVCEIASGRPVRSVQHDRRCVEKPELRIQPRNRRLDHLRRPAMAAVRPVRPDRDGVEMATSLQDLPFALSLSKGCLSGRR